MYRVISPQPHRELDKTEAVPVVRMGLQLLQFSDVFFKVKFSFRFSPCILGNCHMYFTFQMLLKNVFARVFVGTSDFIAFDGEA